MGLNPKNVVIPEVGNVIEVNRSGIRKSGTVISGQIFVDGLGVGDVGNIVLKDRRNLSKDGIINVIVAIERESHTIVGGPDIITRGFVYVRESEALVNEIKEISYESIQKSIDNNIFKWSEIKNNIRNDIGSFIYSKTKRKPVIVPIIMEV